MNLSGKTLQTHPELLEPNVISLRWAHTVVSFYLLHCSLLFNTFSILYTNLNDFILTYIILLEILPESKTVICFLQPLQPITFISAVPTAHDFN